MHTDPVRAGRAPGEGESPGQEDGLEPSQTQRGQIPRGEYSGTQRGETRQQDAALHAEKCTATQIVRLGK